MAIIAKNRNSFLAHADQIMAIKKKIEVLKVKQCIDKYKIYKQVKKEFFLGDVVYIYIA